MSSLEQCLVSWQTMLGLPHDVPQWLVAILVVLFVYVVVILPGAAVMSYLERKLNADFQARVGPNRSGPAGIFQPFSDLLKLLQKESSHDWSWNETLWLGVHTMALYSTVAVIPLGSAIILVNTDMSALLPLWSAMVLALGTMLMGFGQNSVNGWFGGVRLAAQAVTGALPALICILCAGVNAGGFRWTKLAQTQGSSPLHWTATSNPFQFIAFVVFVISGLVLMSVPPMDGGLSKTDLHGGVSSDLSGRRLSLFRMGRFYGIFLWSVMAVVIFLGAWNLPQGLIEQLGSNGGGQGLREFVELFVLLIKTFSLMILLSWVARVSPRGRVDQTTDFAWKVLSPFSLLALVGAGLWVGWRSLL